MSTEHSPCLSKRTEHFAIKKKKKASNNDKLEARKRPVDSARLTMRRSFLLALVLFVRAGTGFNVPLATLSPRGRVYGFNVARVPPRVHGQSCHARRPHCQRPFVHMSIDENTVVADNADSREQVYGVDIVTVFTSCTTRFGCICAQHAPQIYHRQIAKQ